MKKITVTLSDELHKALVALAKRERRSMHAQIIVIIEKSIQDNQGHANKKL